MLINFVDATNDANRYTKPPPKTEDKTEEVFLPGLVVGSSRIARLYVSVVSSRVRRARPSRLARRSTALHRPVELIT